MTQLGAVVARINVTPVKGLRLDNPGAVELTAAGARDDRRFLLVDRQGRLVNGKRIGGRLNLAAAAWDAGEERLTVRLPGGEEVSALVERRDELEVEVYGRHLRCRVVDGPYAEALSGLAGLEVQLVERPEGSWATDARPATLVSQASLDAFGGDGRRFRMLLELDGLDAYGEERWQGWRVGVGETELLVEQPTPRCALPSYDPDTGERTGDMLREILDGRGAIEGLPCLGVYAEVVGAGVVRVGDAVERVGSP
ncbi:MAG TPA: MOSC N-terminal beta barrel domain-containing protein [Gaiellaceae bacterium]|nr:MOSC N-terminal beta barrel domain-containing protein [Gaiellaceae bacterium]